MKLLEISSILVRPRQRSRMSAQPKTDLRDAILSRGLLQPIGIWYDPQEGGTTPVLCYGGRRLAVISELAERPTQIVFEGKTVPLGKIPCVEFRAETLADAKDAELLENTAREELSWQDKSRALAEIHQLRRDVSPDQTVSDTARELAVAGGLGDAKTLDGIRKATTMALLIAPHLDDPEVAKAKSASDAFQIVTRKQTNAGNAELIRRRSLTTTSEPPVRLIHGEALSELSKLPATNIDLVLTDPPYGVNAQEDNFSKRQAQTHGYEDDPTKTLAMLQDFLIAAHRVCKTKANLLMFVDPDNFAFLRGAAQRAGWTTFRTPIIWNKLTPGIGPWQTEGFQRQYEFLLFATKGPKGLERPAPDVLSFRRVPTEQRRHAAQKPQDLLEFLIDLATLPGDLVLDPFAGSASTLLAAKAKSRRAVGIESDKAFIDSGLVALFGETP